MLKDTELQELFGLPRQTLQDFKNRDKDNWRYKVYNFLKVQNSETVKKTFEVLELDKVHNQKS